MTVLQGLIPEISLFRYFLPTSKTQLKLKKIIDIICTDKMCSLDDSAQIFYNFQAHVLNLSILWYSQCSAICYKGHGWKHFDGNVHKNFVFINATT